MTGLFHYQSMLANIPYVNRFVAQPTTGNATESYSALKQENDNLNKQVQALTLEDAVLSKGAQSNNDAAGIGTDGVTAENPVFDQTQQQVYKNLANYYANMQPASAVAILGNQDQQTVAEILYEMDKDQASPILAAMDPAQAAKLLKLIAGIDSEVTAQSSGPTTGE
jgi:flagellar motility protein MotE (MotC chaperone)